MHTHIYALHSHKHTALTQYINMYILRQNIFLELRRQLFTEHNIICNYKLKFENLRVKIILL